MGAHNSGTQANIHTTLQPCTHHQRQQEEEHRHQRQHVKPRGEAEVVEVVHEEQRQGGAREELDAAYGAHVDHAVVLPQHHHAEDPQLLLACV